MTPQLHRIQSCNGVIVTHLVVALVELAAALAAC